MESRIQEVLTWIPLHAAIHCGILHESSLVLSVLIARFSGHFLNVFHSKKKICLETLYSDHSFVLIKLSEYLSRWR